MMLIFIWLVVSVLSWLALCAAAIYLDDHRQLRIWPCVALGAVSAIPVINVILVAVAALVVAADVLERKPGRVIVRWSGRHGK